MGLFPEPVALCARLLPFPNAFAIGAWAPDHRFAVNVNLNLGTGIWEVGAPFGPTPFGVHFPYGFNVLGD